MTTVRLEKNNDNIICVTVKGHAGFASYGKDIVCAGVSSIVQTAVLGIKDIANIKHKYEFDESTGYLKLQLIDIENTSKFNSAQIVLKTMELGVKDLAKQYPKYLIVEDKQI